MKKRRNQFDIDAEREMGLSYVKQYFPNVKFSEFEIRKIGQLLTSVYRTAQATGKPKNDDE
jgi:hypothetical protein